MTCIRFYRLFFEDFELDDRKGSIVGDTDVEGTSDGWLLGCEDGSVLVEGTVDDCKVGTYDTDGTVDGCEDVDGACDGLYPFPDFVDLYPLCGLLLLYLLSCLDIPCCWPIFWYS